MPDGTYVKKFGQFKFNRLIACTMLLLGIIFFICSAFYASPLAAIAGLGLTFWGALLLYIAPSKHVKIEMLNASTASTIVNMEKILTNLKINNTGVYLPPKCLKNKESSLVYIPATGASQPLPKPEEVNEEKLYLENPKGILLTPPGLALTKLFEKEIGTTFLKTDLNYIRLNLPKLFVENLEIAEEATVEAQNDTVTVELKKHAFQEICSEAQKLSRTHKAIGCPLCSAIACALTKATAKPIKIVKEEQTPDGKTIKIHYQILDE